MNRNAREGDETHLSSLIDQLCDSCCHLSFQFSPPEALHSQLLKWRHMWRELSVCCGSSDFNISFFGANQKFCARDAIGYLSAGTQWEDKRGSEAAITLRLLKNLCIETK